MVAADSRQAPTPSWVTASAWWALPEVAKFPSSAVHNVLVEWLSCAWRNLEYGSVCKAECVAGECSGVNFSHAAPLRDCGLHDMPHRRGSHIEDKWIWLESHVRQNINFRPGRIDARLQMFDQNRTKDFNVKPVEICTFFLDNWDYNICRLLRLTSSNPKITTLKLITKFRTHLHKIKDGMTLIC